MLQFPKWGMLKWSILNCLKLRLSGSFSVSHFNVLVIKAGCVNGNPKRTYIPIYTLNKNLGRRLTQPIVAIMTNFDLLDIFYEHKNYLRVNGNPSFTHLLTRNECVALWPIGELVN